MLADPRVEHLLHTLPPVRGLRTHRTADFLRWRYRFPELAYRTCTLGNDPTDGLAIFRLRPRGNATEAALCDVLVPAGATATEARARSSGKSCTRAAPTT